MFKKGKRLLSRLKRDERGQVMVLFAAALVVLMGVTAFVVDVGFLQWQKGHLQNTADAAARAGAMELIDGGEHNINAVVEDYVEAHGVDSGDIQAILVDGNKVTVELKGTRGLYFARALEIDSKDVAARASAVVGPPGGMGGLIPMAIRQSHLDSGFKTIITKDNFGWDELGSGNWGWVNLAYAYGQNPNTEEQIEYIMEGYPKTISIGQKIKTDTGANLTTPAYLNGPLGDRLDEYIEEETTLFIPIICDTEGQGSYEVEVLGFAAITIISHEGKSSKFAMDISYDPNQKFFVNGNINPGGINYGLQVVSLTD